MRRQKTLLLVMLATFAGFSFIQTILRPSDTGEIAWLTYAYGIAPNFLPAIGIPCFLCVAVEDFFSSRSFLYSWRYATSAIFAVSGLVGNEFIQAATPGPGVFDWHDVLWSILGGVVFLSAASFFFAPEKKT